MPESSGGHATLAATYIDAGCYAEALREVDLADENLVREAGSRDLKDTKATTQRGLRQLVSGLQRLEAGRRDDAIDALFALVDSNYSTMVRMQTTMSLGDILAPRATDSQWTKFEGYLQQLDPGGNLFWQVARFRRLHEVYAGRAADALRNLAKDLEGESVPQYHLALQVVLAEVLVADKRFASARIQCAKVQEAVQAELVELRLRQRFLTTCLQSWRADGRVNRDSRAATMIRLQEAAVAKFEALY
jgi:hypothetical protein